MHSSATSSAGLTDRVLVRRVVGVRPPGAGEAGVGQDRSRRRRRGFLVGTRVKGAMIGEFPGLATGLDDDGNVKATSDFRGIYASLLEQWLGADASAVIPGADSFARSSLLT